MGYERWWGSDAEYDLAQDLEDYYELTEGKSAVLWAKLEDDSNEGYDDLKGRPNEYTTLGYTDEFEGWGQRKVAEAVANGNETFMDVFSYITNEEF